MFFVRPTVFEVAPYLLALFNALHSEGLLLDDTKCDGMLVGTATTGDLPDLFLSAERIAELADEILSSKHLDQAYQKGVCAYLTALDRATTLADELIEWVDRYGDGEIREFPDWYKLELARDV